MDYLDKFILDTWKKIPRKFIKRVSNLEVITDTEHKILPGRTIELKKDSLGTYQVVIYTKPIKSRFQKDINNLIIEELARVFGFDEQEAYELMSKK